VVIFFLALIAAIAILMFFVEINLRNDLKVSRLERDELLKHCKKFSLTVDGVEHKFCALTHVHAWLMVEKYTEGIEVPDGGHVYILKEI